jgi:putative transposase
VSQSYTCLYYHVFFSTKRRRALITSDLRERLYSYIGGVAAHEKGRLICAGGADDHVHLLVSLRAQTALADMLRLLKTNSSKWVHETFVERRNFGWQDGYSAFSVSHSNVERVRRYIAQQEQHHRRVSFQEELLEFLKRHNIEYDERYIWT